MPVLNIFLALSVFLLSVIHILVLDSAPALQNAALRHGFDLYSFFSLDSGCQVPLKLHGTLLGGAPVMPLVQ